jgi:hypothetical protein
MNQIIGIAIDEYSDENIPDLHNCLSDINRVATILQRDYKFDSFILLAEMEQTTKTNIHNQLRNILLNAKANDSVTILYAGHGEYDQRLNSSFILASDSLFSDSSTWFSLKDLNTFINASHAQHINLISDACFAGNIFENNLRGGGYQAFTNKKSRLALTSGGVEPVSDGPKGKNSPFNDTLFTILSNNRKKKMLFSELANQVILSFEESHRQTPLFGELQQTGHANGCFAFEKRPVKEKDFVIEDYSISLDLQLEQGIEYSCSLPLFTSCKFFNVGIVNAQIQSLAFSAISDVRKMVMEDLKDPEIRKNLRVNLEISYQIVQLTAEYFSLLINVGTYFGGPYPNVALYCFNLALRPERILELRDLIDFYDFDQFMSEVISKIKDRDTKNAVKRYSDTISEKNIMFTFDKKILNLHLDNIFPHVIQAIALVEIPLKSLKLKI